MRESAKCMPKMIGRASELQIELRDELIYRFIDRIKISPLHSLCTLRFGSGIKCEIHDIHYRLAVKIDFSFSKIQIIRSELRLGIELDHLILYRWRD